MIEVYDPGEEGEIQVSLDWRAAVAQIAPAPDPDGEFNELATLRYELVQYVAGQGGEDPPTAITYPRYKPTVRSVLSALVEIPNLPPGWEKRFKRVQVDQNPELADVFGPDDQYSDPIARLAGMLELLVVISEAEEEKETWVDRAKCKGADPNIFHILPPEKGTGTSDRAKRRRQDVIDDALAYCNGCRVQEQCLAYGQRHLVKGMGPVVYGNRVLLKR